MCWRTTVGSVLICAPSNRSSVVNHNRAVVVIVVAGVVVVRQRLQPEQVTGVPLHDVGAQGGQIKHAHTSGVAGAPRVAHSTALCNDSLTSSCTFGRTAVTHLPDGSPS